jgi:hypothetical protein
LLFNLVVDMLATFIARAKEEGQIDGLVPHLVDGCLSILQYTDEAILFMDHNFEQVKNMKLLLCAFEQPSDLKINFYKSELFYYVEAKNLKDQNPQLFDYEMGQYPFRYLGIFMHHKKINNIHLKMIEDNFF